MAKETVHSDGALVEEVMDLVARWPQLEEMRRAGGHRGRWEQALSLVVASARSEMVAALRGARRYAASSGGGVKKDVECAVLMVHGSLRHAALRLLQRGGLCVLSKAWRWTAEREVEAANAICGIAGEAKGGQDSMFHELTDRELQAATEVFPHTTSSFGAALAAGVEWDTAILGHVQQAKGWYDTGGRRFRFSDKDGQSLGGKGARACKSFQIPAREGEPAIIQFWDGNQLLGLESSARIRLQRPGARQVRDRDGRPTYSRWLPEYIRLPKDKRGGIAKQLPVVTVVDRREEWRRLIGNVDAVTWAIVSGQMVYPRRCWMLQGSWLRNHPSWDQPRVRLKLGANSGSGYIREHWNGYHLGAPTLPSLSQWAQCPRRGPTSSGLLQTHGTEIKG